MPKNVRKGKKLLAVPNTLAYYDMTNVGDTKTFMIAAPCNSHSWTQTLGLRIMKQMLYLCATTVGQEAIDSSQAALKCN